MIIVRDSAKISEAAVRRHMTHRPKEKERSVSKKLMAISNALYHVKLRHSDFSVFVGRRIISDLGIGGSSDEVQLRGTLSYIVKYSTDHLFKENVPVGPLHFDTLCHTLYPRLCEFWSPLTSR